MNEDLELFYEDSLEQLKNLEEGLLEITQNGVSSELIGQIFRSFHTIKGSAGMFDFELIVNFTHKAESLLDAIRNGKKEMNEDLVMLFFECKDYIELLLDSVINGVVLDEATLKHGKHIESMLLEYLGGSASTTHSSSAGEVVFEDDVSDDLWDIKILFGEEFFTSGMDIFSVLKFLNKQGTVQELELHTQNIPTLEAYEPLRPYFSISLVYDTQIPKDEIEEIFEFIIDDITLTIEKQASQPKAMIPQMQVYVNPEPLEQKEVFIEAPKTLSSIEVQTPTNATQTNPMNTTPKEKGTTFRVDSQKIDSIINSMSQMVITHGKIFDIASKKFDDSDFIEELEGFSSLIEELRNSIMGIRLMPIGDSFGKFKRIVVDTAKKLDKDVEFVIKGEETEIDKTILEKISDPLVHMLRNSLDHGLESKEERAKTTKNPKGIITLDVSVDGGTILIVISDDGKGINKAKVLEKAIANNIVKSTDSLSDKEIFQLIFSAGLSTADKLSDISGRGVGMDVVKSNIEELRGNIDVDSKEGLGSTFTIRLPSSLAIIDGLLVKVGTRDFIIPIENILECVEYDLEFRKKHQTDDYIRLNNELIPILYANKYFHIDNSFDQTRENIVVVQIGKEKIAILVDELIGEMQCVLKPLGILFEDVKGINSATILGNGDIAFVIDVAKFIEIMRSEHE